MDNIYSIQSAKECMYRRRKRNDSGLRREGGGGGDSCREKAVPKPAGSDPEAPVMPLGGEELEQSMGRMRGVLENATRPL